MFGRREGLLTTDLGIRWSPTVHDEEPSSFAARWKSRVTGPLSEVVKLKRILTYRRRRVSREV